MVSVTVREEHELEGVARAVLDALTSSTERHIITLTGDLGAGKTTFTKAIAKVLGVTDHVTSPTFVIMKSYALTDHPRFSALVHIDAYRVESDDELTVLGFNALAEDAKKLTVIEWPERLHGLIPDDAFRVRVEITDTNDRLITYGD
jgi:tRNA threonylcarbamoyladenosine biosynthesis protein TsaE